MDLEAHHTSLETNLPKINYPEANFELDENLIEKYAKELRACWGLGNGPVVNLTNVAQKNGIMISQMPLGVSKIDAFSVWYDGIPYIFLSADKLSNARIRFDIAHELGHLIMHSDIYSEDDFEKGVIKYGRDKTKMYSVVTDYNCRYQSELMAFSIDKQINKDIKQKNPFLHCEALLVYW